MAAEGPKSAYELAMERLRQKDREAGVAERPLTDAQKAAIAEARQIYQARMAEREILHRDALLKARTGSRPIATARSPRSSSRQSRRGRAQRPSSPIASAKRW